MKVSRHRINYRPKTIADDCCTIVRLSSDAIVRREYRHNLTNDFKLYKKSCSMRVSLDLSFFSKRVVNACNNLPPSIDFRSLKVGFHYPSSRAEFTGRVDGPRTRVHFLTPVNSGRELG